MTDERFRLFARIVNGLCVGVALVILTTTSWNRNGQWSVPVIVVVFDLGVAIQIAVGRRRPGHEHDSIRETLR